MGERQTMKQLEATIYGRVQGVSFRYHTSLEANRLNLVGWVANQSDGSVHTIAQGPETALQQYLTFLHKGSPAARVERVVAKWGEPSQQFSRFRIRP